MEVRGKKTYDVKVIGLPPVVIGSFRDVHIIDIVFVCFFIPPAFLPKGFEENYQKVYTT